MIGANREIKAFSKLVRDREESLFAFFAEEGIEWSFIPPRSPNWGGLWEANIKSLKYHFKHVAGNSNFSYEELLTLIMQIEAILNSRPLTPLSSDVDDFDRETDHSYSGTVSVAMRIKSFKSLPENN
ncbi:integrase catalytic domain-containing protein [Trichonephila clavipes]|nr:integrase catalytic domain-containing protein [Trichonephila clavipes]